MFLVAMLGLGEEEEEVGREKEERGGTGDTEAEEKGEGIERIFWRSSQEDYNESKGNMK